MKLPLLHQDDHLLVINKPAGLLSAPDRHDPDLPHVSQLLRRKFETIYRVHRLDRDTSGLMVLARTQEAQGKLSQQFEQRQVEKVYTAIVDGVPEVAEGEIDEPIASHPARAGQVMVSSRGKFARTDYKVLEPLGQFARLGVQIFTGRTHQIRVHLAYIGHPLMVDPMYGKRSGFLLSEIKGRRRYNLSKGAEERPLLGRTPLHAGRLGFTHPVSGEFMRFEVEEPKDMRAVANQLRKLA